MWPGSVSWVVTNSKIGIQREHKWRFQRKTWTKKVHRIITLDEKWITPWMIVLFYLFPGLEQALIGSRVSSVSVTQQKKRWHIKLMWGSWRGKPLKAPPNHLYRGVHQYSTWRESQTSMQLDVRRQFICFADFLINLPCLWWAPH